MPVTTIKGGPVIRGSGYPLLARVRKGESQEAAAARAKREGKSRFTPQDLNYFRIQINRDLPSSVGDAEKIDQAIKHLYGEQPEVITGVQFLSDDPDTVFSTAYEQWLTTKKGNSVCTRRCDGTNTYFRNHPEHGVDRSPTPCQCDWNTTDPKKREELCALTGRLIFCLPALTRATGILGELMLITHSSNDVSNILSMLYKTRQIFGQLHGLSFTLYRRPTPVITPDGKPTIKNAVYLQTEDGSSQQIAASMTQNTLLLESSVPVVMPQLPSGNSSTKGIPFEQMYIAEREGQQTFWFADPDGKRYKTTDQALVEQAVPLAGIPKAQWVDVLVDGLVDGDTVIKLWRA